MSYVSTMFSPAPLAVLRKSLLISAILVSAGNRSSTYRSKVTLQHPFPPQSPAFTPSNSPLLSPFLFSIQLPFCLPPLPMHLHPYYLLIHPSIPVPSPTSPPHPHTLIFHSYLLSPSCWAESLLLAHKSQ